MRKLLRPGDVLLLGLAGAIDLFEEFQDPAGLGKEEAKQLYGWVSRRYKRHNFSRLIQKQLRTDYIEKRVKDGEVYLRLTSQGKKVITRDFPVLSLANRKWDKKWRVIIFDFEELNRKKRDRFRSKLKELGFGMLQESVWITPHDVAQDMYEFLEASKMDSQVFVLEVSTILASDQLLLVNKIWKIFELNERYENLLIRIQTFSRMYVTHNDRGIKHTSKIQKLREEYLKILITDPCLPKELLPENWAGEKARKALKNL